MTMIKVGNVYRDTEDSYVPTIHRIVKDISVDNVTFEVYLTYHSTFDDKDYTVPLAMYGRILKTWVLVD